MARRVREDIQLGSFLVLVAMALYAVFCGPGSDSDAFPARTDGPATTPNKPFAVSKKALEKQAPPVRKLRLSRIPITFEENRGQAHPQVRYLSRSKDSTLFLTATEAVIGLSMRRRASDQAPGKKVGDEKAASFVRLSCAGALSPTNLRGEDASPTRSNYFLGNDASRWVKNVPHHKAIRYERVYPGIDLVYHGRNGVLEYDFEIAPGADPYGIVVNVEGLVEGPSGERIELQADGSLLLHTPSGPLLQKAPFIFQDKEGRRNRIEGRYRILVREGEAEAEAEADLGHARFGFEVAAYDRSRTLVIDPAIVYSSYLGGVNTEFMSGIEVDASGAAYVIGDTTSMDFPTAGSPFQSIAATGQTIFVAKINSAGNALVYATYVGGIGNDDDGQIALDSSGNVYASGTTTSVDFPTVTPVQGALSGSSDAFVFQLDPNGSNLGYSTYLGGSGFESARDIDLDASNAPYIVGTTGSSNFPVTGGAVQSTLNGSADMFVVKLTPAGTAINFATYLGGSGSEDGFGIGVDNNGDVTVCGSTDSSDYPTQAPFQAALAGGQDIAVTKLDSIFSSMRFSTYLGGSNNDPDLLRLHLSVDRSSGEVFVAATTTSTDFPTQSAFQNNTAGGRDIVASKFRSDGSALDFSTYLGGSGTDSILRTHLSPSGELLIVGGSSSTNFPTVDPIQGTHTGDGLTDAILVKLDAAGDVAFSTFLGTTGGEGFTDVDLDASGNAYVAGFFPTDVTTTGGFQPARAGGTDGFIVKISDLGSGATAQPQVIAVLTATPQDGIAPQTISFDGTGSTDGTGGSITTFAIDFGDGTTDSNATGIFSHTYATPGIFTAKLTVTSSSGQVSSATPFPLVLGDGITTDTDLFAAKAQAKINFKAKAKGENQDSFTIAGLLNLAGAPDNLSAGTVRLLINDTEVGAATNPKISTTARNSNHASPRAKGLSFIPIIKSNGSYSFKVTGTDLAGILGIFNQTGTQTVRMDVRVETTGLNLDAPAIRGVFEQPFTVKRAATAKRKFSFIKLPTATGFFKSQRTSAKLGKGGGYTITAKGPVQAEFAVPLVPVGDVSLTIGSGSGVVITIPQGSLTTKGAGASSTLTYSSKAGTPVTELKKFQISNAKKKFILTTNELAGTGIPGVGGGVTVFNLPIIIDVPTASGNQRLDTTVEIKRSNDQSKSWKR